MKANSLAIMRSAEEELARLDASRTTQTWGWSGGIVLSHLVNAYGTLRRLPESGRHRAIRSVWPDDTYAMKPDVLETERFAAEVHAIALGEDEIRERQKEQNRAFVSPSPVDIDRMAVALIWPARFIEERHLRITVMKCSMIRAHNLPLRAMCRKFGWPYSTTFARCERAGAIIADALNQGRVAVW